LYTDHQNIRVARRQTPTYVLACFVSDGPQGMGLWDRRGGGCDHQKERKRRERTNNIFLCTINQGQSESCFESNPGPSVHVLGYFNVYQLSIEKESHWGFLCLVDLR
jgi:hypothetical protein